MTSPVSPLILDATRNGSPEASEAARSVTSPVSPLILDAVRSTLRDEETDRCLLAYTLTLPSLATLGEYVCLA